MFWQLIKGSFSRRTGKMLLIAFTVALGVSLATAMINTMLGVGDKINRELKTYGANINITPRESALLGELYGIGGMDTAGSAFLKEEELPKIKQIFWGHNIVNYAPFLTLPVNLLEYEAGSGKPLVLVGTWYAKPLSLVNGEKFVAGLQSLKQWWHYEGEILRDDDEEGIMCGSILAEKLGLKVGDKIKLACDPDFLRRSEAVEDGGEEKAAPAPAPESMEFKLKAIFSSGSEDDEKLYAGLAAAQKLAAAQGKISYIEVQALTTPDNDLARKAAKSPTSLTLKEWETWYCTAYVSAICYQLEDVISDSAAKAVRKVAESEGAILDKISLLMTGICLLSLLGSAFAISNLISSAVMERSSEIALMLAIGARSGTIVRQFLTEIILASALGGVFGYFVGLGFTSLIGHSVFASSIPAAPMAIPLIAISVLLVALIGSLPAMRHLMALKPAEVLHGR